MIPLTISARAEVWPLAAAFVISRGTKSAAHVVVAEITDGAVRGRGEAVPYARYGETVASVLEQIARVAGQVRSREGLPTALPPGAARNALDCAFWDFDAKRAGATVAELAGLKQPQPVLTAYTLSLDTPDAMAARARAVPHLPLLKLKLGGAGDSARLVAIRAARPDARLIVDANEGSTPEQLWELLAAARDAGVELIEQPLPAGQDEALLGRPPGITICGDESVHTCDQLADLAQRYDAINVKLDKAGGLTEALALVRAAQALGLDVMVGCMVGTSLAMAPALLLANQARWVDLDGPLLLAKDRENGLTIENGIISPPSPELWG
jgi:L-Ala-D/L-Glu epimerase